MRGICEARARWEATVKVHTEILSLKAAIRKPAEQNPCLTGLRSICWKVFLLFRNLDTSTWPKTLSDSRSAYVSLKEHYMKSIDHSDDLSAEDPLTDTDTSPWNVIRLDEELRAEIFQDVERCMPEISYFREPQTQSMLLDILFVYCKLNKDIGYRQGMHEVLAPIVWVISCDAVNDEGQSLSADLDHEVCSNLDQAFIEHDAFTLFGIIMQTVKTFYETGSTNGSTTSGLLNNSPIMERSKRIHEHYLHHTDPELAEHLTDIEVLPQIFLIRWIRLLFGREFPFEEVLALWDMLFAEDPQLDLIDLVAVSMLLRIRWQLLEADYTAALTLLLRYPVPSTPHGPQTFASDALYLRDNLLLDGGDHLISKYSQKAPETTVTRKLPKKIKRARTNEQVAIHNAEQKLSSPKLSPGKFLQEQGGLEGIIQEAAKGVYNQGERWGVAKALRGAVHGLQTGSASPRKVSDKSRWSLDDGVIVSESPKDLNAKIHVLEERNRSLAKLLEKAMEELWSQQKQFHQDKNETVSEALSLAIAKVQFVQVYLENSTMPLAPENVLHTPDVAESVTKSETESPTQTNNATASLDGTVDGDRLNTSNRDLATNSQQVRLSPTRKPTSSNPGTALASTPSSSNPKRPSLSQSPYSWMLGEEPQKSGFVAASPFSAKKRDEREEQTSLFGGERGNARSPRGVKIGLVTESASDGDDVFTTRSLDNVNK